MIETLVLSLFPGIGLLDMAFAEEGFCIVRGPDLLWGGDIRRFHPPAGVFGGVIGGPPCQFASRLRHLNPLAGKKQGNLIPEFERCVAEARPIWWLMENVPEAPEPQADGYITRSLLLNNRWVEGGVQHRKRRFSFGTVEGLALQVDIVLFEDHKFALAITSHNSQVPVKLGGSGKIKAMVLAGHGPIGKGSYKVNLSIADMCELQGLPRDFLADDDVPFTAQGKRRVIGNGVPLPMGRAIARAVKKAIAP